MKHLLLSAVLFSAAAPAETVYRCASVYTDTPSGPACQTVDLTGAPNLSLNRPSEKPANGRPSNQDKPQTAADKAAENAQKARLKAELEHEKALSKAEKKWRRAEAALERGKKRKISGKNLARHRENLRALEAKAAQAKQEWQALQQR